VIWDNIITTPSSDHLSRLGPASLKKLRKSSAGKSIDPSRGLLSLKNQKPKYQITHPTGKIGSTEEVVLRLHYNVQPWIGVLTWNTDRDLGRWRKVAGGVSKAFALPAVKAKEEKKAT
jgi:signal peptidase complex subunit 3